eukprot:COSAG01_NODE_24338_length_782_cov_6.159590_1_plen_108_part_10
MGGANNTSVHPRTYARKQPQPRTSATIHTQALHMRAHRHSRRSSLWHLRAKQPLHSLKRAWLTRCTGAPNPEASPLADAPHPRAEERSQLGCELVRGTGSRGISLGYC